MTDSAPDEPLFLFDSDDYLYIIRDVHAAQGWLEPLTVEEAAGLFDRSGRPVTITGVHGRYMLDLASSEPDESALRQHINNFLSRRGSGVESSAPLAELLDELCELRSHWVG